MKVALEVKVYSPLGNNRAMIGVINCRLVVKEMVTVSPGPPALPTPPAKLEIRTLEIGTNADC